MPASPREQCSAYLHSCAHPCGLKACDAFKARQSGSNFGALACATRNDLGKVWRRPGSFYVLGIAPLKNTPRIEPSNFVRRLTCSPTHSSPLACMVSCSVHRVLSIKLVRLSQAMYRQCVAHCQLLGTAHCGAHSLVLKRLTFFSQMLLGKQRAKLHATALLASPPDPTASKLGPRNWFGFLDSCAGQL